MDNERRIKCRDGTREVDIIYMCRCIEKNIVHYIWQRRYIYKIEKEEGGLKGDMRRYRRGIWEVHDDDDDDNDDGRDREDSLKFHLVLCS